MGEDTMIRREIKKLIKQLKKNKISVLDIPEKYQDSEEIILFEVIFKADHSS